MGVAPVEANQIDERIEVLFQSEIKYSLLLSRVFFVRIAMWGRIFFSFFSYLFVFFFEIFFLSSFKTKLKYSTFWLASKRYFLLCI